MTMLEPKHKTPRIPKAGPFDLRAFLRGPLYNTHTVLFFIPLGSRHCKKTHYVIPKAKENKLLQKPVKYF